MRRYLLEQLDIQEGVVTVRDLEEADEIFLTNAINGLRWVERFRGHTFGNKVVATVREKLQAASFKLQARL
jgi:branched-chain amino acid aminotransferase